jgi:hypothetical protein
MKYPDPIKRAGSYAGEVIAAARRRKQNRSPRVRVRVAHGETKVLAADSEAGARLLALADELVSEYGRGGRG